MRRAALLGWMLVGTACASAATSPPDAPVEEGPREAGAQPLLPEEDPRTPLFDDKQPPHLLDESFTIAGQPVKHVLPAEQLVRTPVPIYIEPSPSLGVKRAQLQYKPFGAVGYAPLDLPRLGDGFGVEIPCRDLLWPSDLRYFILLFGEEDQQLGTLGSRAFPLKIAIKPRLAGGLPSLPGHPPPRQCPPPPESPPAIP